MTRAHVIGAGLSGLSAAIALTEAGYQVKLSEAAAHAGGRCRSYHDPALEMTIDNGNHLVLSGNGAVADYLATIGASDRLTGPDEARFSFVDLDGGLRWHLRPNRSRTPWWIASRHRRVPGTRLWDYLKLARLLRPPPGARIGDIGDLEGPVWERLMTPLLVSALNTDPAEASAALAAAVIQETLAKGGAACCPRVVAHNLAATFVEPALAWLAAHGALIRFGRRLKEIKLSGGRLVALSFSDGDTVVAENEPVVLAVPAWVAADLIPDLVVPDAHRAIVNAHFRLAPPPGAEPIMGVIGGTAEWIFAMHDRFSVTISAADRLWNEDRAALAARLWSDVARAYRLSDPLPAWQIVRERRATFAATPEQDARRPGPVTRWPNLMLAGDWTQTGLPATIEGAIRSGRTAAAHAQSPGETHAGR
jgi:squalene-associated FAD-dependent desaturase